MSEGHLTDPITLACLAAGSFTISAGTMEPSIVIERLLVALSILSASEYRRVLAPDGPLASPPAAALRDEASGWWSTDEASAFLQTVIGAINAAAPAGYACTFTGLDRIELVRVEAEGFDGAVGLALSDPPHVSAVRARVR